MYLQFISKFNKSTDQTEKKDRKINSDWFFFFKIVRLPYIFVGFFYLPVSSRGYYRVTLCIVPALYTYCRFVKIHNLHNVIFLLLEVNT